MAPDHTAIGVSCKNCGLGRGHYTVDGDVRCDGCGRFATKSDRYCGRHGIDKRTTPTGMGCPHCEQEAHRDALIQEQQARRADPTMHPTVDAPISSTHPGDMSPSDYI